MVIIFSGAAPSLMGLQAEDWTAQELRRLRRHGWYSIDGLMLRSNSDIDHVVVGPGGVLVVETKWSAERWPTDDQGRGYMDRALARAVDQVRENCRLVWLTFARDIPREHVRAVCVLWSNQTGTEDEVREIDGVTIVPVSRLHGWLRDVEVPVINGAQIDRITTALGDHVDRRDAEDEKRGVVYRPTLRSVLLRSVLSPLLGALGAMYASRFIDRASGDWKLALPSMAGLVVIGVLAQRIREVRQIALGWTLGAGFSVLVLLIIVVRGYS
jgi:hypothetical protein